MAMDYIVPNPALTKHIAASPRGHVYPLALLAIVLIIVGVVVLALARKWGWARDLRVRGGHHRFPLEGIKKWKWRKQHYCTRDCKPSEG
jgi:hypothetical protein